MKKNIIYFLIINILSFLSLRADHSLESNSINTKLIIKAIENQNIEQVINEFEKIKKSVDESSKSELIKSAKEQVNNCKDRLDPKKFYNRSLNQTYNFVSSPFES